MKTLQLDYDYQTREQMIDDIFCQLQINHSYEIIDNKIRFFIPKQEINCEIFDLDDDIKVHIL